jgi:hypothetical protein
MKNGFLLMACVLGLAANWSHASFSHVRKLENKTDAVIQWGVIYREFGKKDGPIMKEEFSDIAPGSSMDFTKGNTQRVYARFRREVSPGSFTGVLVQSAQTGDGNWVLSGSNGNYVLEKK